MLARLRKLQEEHEGGFTLIELLVVIIIIGILAAIAIPIFLSQRQKGYDAGIKSDLRNAATAEESYLTDYNQYTTSQANLTSFEGFKPSSSSDYTNGSQTITIEYLDKNDAKSTTIFDQGYCISATSASGHTFAYDSENGGLGTTNSSCP
jgi:type IV pilus assembly protein PilA